MNFLKGFSLEIINKRENDLTTSFKRDSMEPYRFVLICSALAHTAKLYGDCS